MLLLPRLLALLALLQGFVLAALGVLLTGQFSLLTRLIGLTALLILLSRLLGLLALLQGLALVAGG